MVSHPKCKLLFFLILACSLIPFPTMFNFHEVSSGVRIQVFWLLQNTLRSGLHIVLKVLYLSSVTGAFWWNVACTLFTGETTTRAPLWSCEGLGS